MKIVFEGFPDSLISCGFSNLNHQVGLWKLRNLISPPSVRGGFSITFVSDEDVVIVKTVVFYF